MSITDSEKKEKRSNLTRVTAGLDDFDYKVVNRMASKRAVSLSEVVRTIIHKWIEGNPQLLNDNYGINFREITEEIERKTYEISIDKELKLFEKDIINELPDFFEMVEEVSVNDIAQHFEVDKTVIKRIIFTHGKEIKKIGINLKLKNDIIYKSKN